MQRRGDTVRFPALVFLGAAGLVATTASLFAAPGCSQPLTSARVRCELDAVRALPKDPLEATVYDAVDVIQRLRACNTEITTDGGSP